VVSSSYDLNDGFDLTSPLPERDTEVPQQDESSYSFKEVWVPLAAQQVEVGQCPNRSRKDFFTDFAATWS